MLFMAGNPKDELDTLNPLDLYRIYCPDASLDSNCNSPLRDDDNTPSFGLFWGGSTLLFNDFGTGEIGDVYKLVRLLYNISYKEALHKVYCDVKELDYSIEKVTYTINNTRNKSEIKFKPRKATEQDRAFWKQYLNKLSTLKAFKVYPIDSFSVNGKIIYCYTLTYAIVIGSRVKIYQPFQKPKYLGNTNKNSIQGWHLLDSLSENDTVYLVSSLKEVMVLYEQGIAAIAPNSESTKIEEHVISLIKQKARVKVLYDWDFAGLKNAKEASLFYNIEISSLQYLETDVKDLSDYRKKYGNEKFKVLCEQLLEESFKE